MTTDINWLDLFSYTFFWRALIACLLAGGICGLIGPYLSWKNLGLYGAALSHAALFPIALGLSFHFAYEFALYPFVLCLSLAIAFFKKKRMASLDSYLAIFYSGFMALGILLLSLFGSGSTEMIHYLFGEVLLVSNYDLILLALMALMLVIFSYKYKNQLILESLQYEIAQVEIKKLNTLEYITYVMIGFCIAASLKIMGIVLLTSLLMAPTLIAAKFTNSLRAHFILSIGLSCLLACGGLLVAISLDLPSGASIASLAMTSFFLTSLLPGK
tara:strand:+ start:13092 stop:13907 length:816 start_codon:yes stop_codon:yes gene_type:complete